jgi:hypothetical protein
VEIASPGSGAHLLDHHSANQTDDGAFVCDALLEPHEGQYVMLGLIYFLLARF